MKDLFKRHLIEQTLFPAEDKEQWIAYLILKEKYKHITYLSHDGYSCDGLADYTKNIVWTRNEVVDWTTKEILLRAEKKFWECTSTEICTIWMRVSGETYKTKTEWLRTTI